MGVFNDLLAIKAFRENKAEIAVRKQRAVLADATTAREQAERALERFREHAVRHERALFDGLCARLVKLHDIEDVQLEVAQLRSRETDHEQQVRTAEAQRQMEAQRLEEEREAHRQATRMKEKFVELAQVFADEQLKELERKEDAELEEAAETRRDRADWDERAEEA